MAVNKRTGAKWLLIASIVCAMGSSATATFAQGLGTQYVPSRPTFSPYFGYFQINTSGLPNYYAFVRPQQQFEQMVQRQTFEANTARVQQQQQAARIQLRSTGQSPLLGVRQDGATAPSPPASFMNYSHYYPAASVPARRRQ